MSSWRVMPQLIGSIILPLPVQRERKELTTAADIWREGGGCISEFILTLTVPQPAPLNLTVLPTLSPGNEHERALTTFP